MFLFFGRAIVLLLFWIMFVIGIIVSFMLYEKDKKFFALPAVSVSLIVIICILNMYVLNQTRAVEINMDDADVVYEYFAIEYEKKYGQNDNKRLDFECDNYSTVSVIKNDYEMAEYLINDVNSVKGTCNGVEYWYDEMAPSSLSFASALCGVCGTMVMRNGDTTFVISYCLRNFDGASNVFPSYPDEFSCSMFLNGEVVN